jgi:muramidase (phage lysozyme)
MSNELGDLLGTHEGGLNDGYNIGYDGSKLGKRYDFSNMTIAEVHRRQHLPLDDPDRLHAVGRYQIVPQTMDELIKKRHLDPDLKFTPETQNTIFADYLVAQNRAVIKHYIEGQPNATLDSVRKAMANEWLSVEEPGGTPGYNRKGQHAPIKLSQVDEAVNAMRTHYQQAIHQGYTPEQAWREVTGRSPVPEKTIDSPEHQASAPQMPGSAPAPNASAPQAPAPPASAPLTPADPGHPDHALNQAIRQGVQQQFASVGAGLTDQQIDNVTAALMHDARLNGVTRVDEIKFSRSGWNSPTGNIIVTEGDRENSPEFANQCAVNIQQAMNTPAQQSYQAFEQVKQQQITQDLEFDRRQELDRQQNLGRSL